MANRKPTLTFWALIVLLCLTLTIIAIRFITQAVALFMSQQVVSANTFTTNALIAPTQLTASAVGRDVQLGWKASGNSDDYVVLGGANGNSNDCVTATLSVISTTHNLNYVDNSRHTPQGTWFCYQTQTRLRSWQSLSNNPRVGVQLGFVATSIRLINDGNHSGCNGSDAQRFGQAAYLDCGDQIVMTFNQPVDPATGPTRDHTVCIGDDHTILLGSTTTSGACSLNEPLNLGKLTGGVSSHKNVRFAATYAWSNHAQTLLVTLGARLAGNQYPSLSADVWTFTPTTLSSKLLSAIGRFHICDNNSGGGNCLPSVRSTTPYKPATPTPTPSATPSATRGPSTPTSSPTSSSTPTLTPTLPSPSAPTATITATRSSATTPVPPTSTTTPAHTATPSLTPTTLASPSATPTPSPTPTVTMKPSPSATSASPATTATPTFTSIPPQTTPTPTATRTPSPTAAPSPTPTLTARPSPLVTPTSTLTH